MPESLRQPLLDWVAQARAILERAARLSHREHRQGLLMTKAGADTSLDRPSTLFQASTRTLEGKASRIRTFHLALLYDRLSLVLSAKALEALQEVQAFQQRCKRNLGYFLTSDEAEIFQYRLGSLLVFCGGASVAGLVMASDSRRGTDSVRALGYTGSGWLWTCVRRARPPPRHLCATHCLHCRCPQRTRRCCPCRHLRGESAYRGSGQSLLCQECSRSPSHCSRRPCWRL